MNLEESNSFVEQMEKNNKNKKTILTILGICAILIVILFIMIAYISHQDSLELKMYVDDKQVPISSTLLLQEGETQYMNVKELASMLGYSYQKGEYKSYTEDSTSCYLKSQYEILSMTADSETVTKYIINESEISEEDETTEQQTEEVIDNSVENQIFNNIVVDSENEKQETFTVEQPIKYINNELYVAFSELPRLFNVNLNLATQNRIKVYSLNYLIKTSTQLATQLGYSEVSNIYENFTAMVDGMLVVSDGTNYGVVSLADGHEIISLKYEDIVYMQNTGEFFVTAEGSAGIIAKDGSTIVKPTEFDSIENFDQLNKLYLVKKDGKYGVIDGNGDAIVYPEYDSIGIENEEEFQSEDIRNFGLLFEECIPVNSNGKVGMIDIEGEERLKCVYDSLGYVANETSSTTNKEENDEDEEDNTNTTSNTTNKTNAVLNDYDSVLTIPESVGIKGIVVNLGGLYGLYDAEVKRLIIPCACTKIYSKTKAGVTTYYLEYNEQEIELESYLEQQGLKSINKSEPQEEIELEEDTENEVQENVTEEQE